jgi:hypothetical protein
MISMPSNQTALKEEVALFCAWAYSYLQPIHEAANKVRVLS